MIQVSPEEIYMTMTNPMKFKFKVQPCQTNAVDSVVDCFAGQVSSQHNTYTIDPGKVPMPLEFTGFKNADLLLTESQLKKLFQFAIICWLA